MLPVVAPMKTVVKQMWFHTIAMVITSYGLLYSIDVEIWAYLGVSTLNVIFALQLLKMKGSDQVLEKGALKVFHGSITYLTLFSALLVLAVFI